MKPYLSIILTDAGYRESFHMLRCLREQTYRDFEVLWIDFYGEANPKVYYYKEKLPLRILDRTEGNGENRKTIYLEAKSINYGIKKARGKLIMKIDADLLIQPDYLDKVVKMHEDKNYIFTSGIDKREPRPQVRSLEWDHVYNNAKLSKLTNYGSCLTVLKKYLVSCGGWDENLIWSGANFPSKDMAWRLISYGLAQRWYSNPIALHPWHPTYRNSLLEFLHLSHAGLHKIIPSLIPPTQHQRLDSLIKDRVRKGVYKVN